MHIPPFLPIIFKQIARMSTASGGVSPPIFVLESQKSHFQGRQVYLLVKRFDPKSDFIRYHVFCFTIYRVRARVKAEVPSPYHSISLLRTRSPLVTPGLLPSRVFHGKSALQFVSRHYHRDLSPFL